MKLNLQELRRLDPEQIWQEFSEKDLKQRESTIRRYSNQTAQIEEGRWQEADGRRLTSVGDSDPNRL